MLVLYLLLTLVMGTAIIIGIVKTQSAVVEGKRIVKKGTVVVDGKKVDKYDTIIERKTWREWAAGRETRINQIEPARRGDILSSDGKVLATTVTVCDLYLDLGKKYERNDKGEEITGEGAKFTGTITDSMLFASLDTVATMLSETMGKPKSHYVDTIKNERKKTHPNGCFKVETEVPYSVWLAIYRLPGWKNCVVREVDRRSVRYNERAHIYQEMASNTVGWEEGRKSGKFTSGLEGAYDSILRGRDGVFNSRRLTKGIWLADIPDEGETVDKRTDADSVQKVVLRKRIDGQSIVATIDTRIQDVAEDALRQSLVKYGGSAGCAIVMEVETGYVVACANLVRFARNGNVEYREVRDWDIQGNDKLARNPAVSGMYHPGSTMKAVVMTAMLNDPKIHIDTTMKVSVRPRLFPKSTKEIRDIHSHGDSLSVRKVIEVSSNPGMAEIGWMYYKEPSRRNDFVALMKQVFPYEILHLDLGAPEYNYTLNDVNRSNDDFLRLTYGYSTTVSPMQIITFYNALAGGGRMVKPLFCRAIIDRDGHRREMPPVVMRERAFSRESAKIMTEMLEGVVNYGTARKVIKDNTYHIAGKTGTANADGNQANNASFAGFFPANRPRYTCYVMLQEVSTSAYGAQAAEVFKMISDCVMAIDERLSEDLFASTAVDSTKLRQEPVMLRGNQQEIAKIFGLLGRSYVTTAKDSTWVVYQSATKDSPSTYMPDKIEKGKMPNCYGMSAKDAVKLLHSLGLKVRLSGYGKVSSQIPKAGSSVAKGETVKVNLK